jgi:2-succinyl-5-enolpyruvyl-6-hydroxy-3-cyclohexene-1-carboxylate synthase
MICSLDFRNTNMLWASVLAETLFRLGLTTAIICPGSRSGPLAIAFAQHPQIEALPILDERSAAFFALGLARRSHLPVAIVCTSGTAGANFYPAVIEAHHNHVPLLVLTADRPPELRHCHAGQAIDQLNLYGTYPNWQAELAIPEVDLLSYLRQTLVHAWQRSLSPTPGPVHLNLPFRDPLAPVSEPAVQALESNFPVADFLKPVQPLHPSELDLVRLDAELLETWLSCDRGLIIAGPAQPADPEGYCRAIAQLAQILNWSVLADGLSPLRNYANLNPSLIAGYDLLLRNSDLADQLSPQIVIQLGELPTSKQLRLWLQKHQPHTWVVDASADNFDPLHGATRHLCCSIEALTKSCVQLGSDLESLAAPQPPNSGVLQNLLKSPRIGGFRGRRLLATKRQKILRHTLTPQKPSSSTYRQSWCTAEAQVQQSIQQTIAQTDELFEGKAAWLLSTTLPAATPVFIASSMPVRDVEWFWQPSHSQIQPYFNRGANGIDGTLSTALGVSHRQSSSILLTGDLALLHDTNGFLIRNQWLGSLTIVLINNNGGGIFGMLPIANFDPPFEPFFTTPQNINFAQLCATYDVEHELIKSWSQLEQRLNPLPAEGIRVLELPCDRQFDAQWRQTHLPHFADNCRLAN